MIEMIVLDVDGTMTNGNITYDTQDNEYKSFNVKDGLAIVSWQKIGKKVAIITGRGSSIVQKRAKELGIKHIYQNCQNKLKKIQEILQEENLTLKNVAAIGDDLNDLQMLKAAKVSFVPRDASAYVDKIANVILTKRGGDGAVREMIEYLIIKEGLEEKYLELWA